MKDNLTIIARFPSDFRFQLNETEKNELVTNCDRFKTLKHSTSNPYAFIEQGVSMLSAILRSDIAVETSIKIIRGVQGMVDRDLAELYGVETKRLNEQVKRNIERFPKEFMFQMTYNEVGNWKSQIATYNKEMF